MKSINSNQHKKRVLGLMTGTSLDAIDIAVVDFEMINGKINLSIIDYDSFDFSDSFRAKVLSMLTNSNLSEICDLNFALSKLYSDSIKEFCTAKQIDFQSIDLISSHGQTVWHNPILHDFADVNINSTLQLGNGSALAAYTTKPVISDFRSADIALGGQGAPLVPRFDYDFLSQKNKHVISLNIGGISNITILKANAGENELIAFDTGPGNVMIDYAANKYFNIKYDSFGSIAKIGKLNLELLDKLFDCSYFDMIPPKSTGRELFNAGYFDAKLASMELVAEDIIHTLSVFTAESICRQIEKFTDKPDELIVSGGGAYNDFIMDYLKSRLYNTQIKTSDDYGIPISAKEAICFAYLGYRTSLGLPSNIPSVTGASREAVLGSVSIV